MFLIKKPNNNKYVVKHGVPKLAQTVKPLICLEKINVACLTSTTSAANNVFRFVVVFYFINNSANSLQCLFHFVTFTVPFILILYLQTHFVINTARSVGHKLSCSPMAYCTT
jgi:hypothetical protein